MAISFLAIRTIQQLTDDEKRDFPTASEIIKKRFHVDNLVTGSNSSDEALKMRDDLIKLLEKGGFLLRQWASNDKKLIESLPENLIFKSESNIIGALGILWSTETDEIIYSVANEEINDFTVRTVLSEIMKFNFDSLGQLSPINILLKLAMQELWKIGFSDWNKTVPEIIATILIRIRKELNKIKEFKFPRCVLILNYINLQIHGFCDASKKAYGACLYIRSTNENGQVLSRLICAKSRVAPLKTVTLARLELCAALLLANLLKVTMEALELNIDRIVLWSDSTITLQCISTPPYKLKTFVANRISEIRSLTNISSWRHVPSTQNPADFISRGQMPFEFANNKMWPNGPSWIVEPES